VPLESLLERNKDKIKPVKQKVRGKKDKVIKGFRAGEKIDIPQVERHLRHLLANYATYYNGVRTHLALNKDTSLHRPAQTVGRIASVTWLGGLHRHYVRMA
jgi:hypothetical protein